MGLAVEVPGARKCGALRTHPTAGAAQGGEISPNSNLFCLGTCSYSEWFWFPVVHKHNMSSVARLVARALTCYARGVLFRLKEHTLVLEQHIGRSTERMLVAAPTSVTSDKAAAFGCCGGSDGR